MPIKPTIYRGTALVTGASAGLGAHYAKFLAHNGMDLILTSRNGEKLDQVAQHLRDTYLVKVSTLPADLANRADRNRLITEIAERDLQVNALINNAGFGYFGDFIRQDTSRVLDEIELNCAAVAHLTRTYLPAMLQADAGFIVNVASTAAAQPIPTMAAYAASKAFVLNLTQALWTEVEGSKVRVIAVNPGPTKTAFFTHAGRPSALHRGRRTPDQVVCTTFRALQKRRPSVVDGLFNKIQFALARRAPLSLVLKVARRSVR